MTFDASSAMRRIVHTQRVVKFQHTRYAHTHTHTYTHHARTHSPATHAHTTKKNNYKIQLRESKCGTRDKTTKIQKKSKSLSQTDMPTQGSKRLCPAAVQY
eukprot:Opistho-2@95801